MKILSNKKYHELLLKSCKGMFGAVTDDMLLKSNAFLAKEKEQLQDELQRKDNVINELKKHIGEEWYCYDNESIEFKVAKDILDKIKELENDN